MKRKISKKTDLEKCRTIILLLLDEYNCSIESDDFHWAWLRDNDTREIIGLEKHCIINHHEIHNMKH